MSSISIEIVKNDAIEVCCDLCNELMALQKMKSRIHSGCFDGMDFHTRMEKSYINALRKQVIVAKDGIKPVGYVFSTVDFVAEDARNYVPEWAPASTGQIGFFPDWVKLPQYIGCLNNLYLQPAYRRTGLGAKLFSMSMQWLESFSDVHLLFVYISNGNDAALNFYLKHGFVFSHDVFGGFIHAACKEKSLIA